MRAALPLLLALAAPLALPQGADDRPPSGRELKGLLEALMAVEPRTPGTRAAQDALLEPYLALPAPGEGTSRKRLLKAIEDAWEDGPELPTKGGEHWYWDEGGERRGRYFLSGRTRRPAGLFIGLHGGGVGSADASGAHAAYRAAADARGWVSLYPQALEATERGWTDAGTEEWIMGLVEEARRTFGVPADRVYIGGHSMGGYGTWTLGAHHADHFAAAVPSAGAPTPVYALGGTEIIDVQAGVVPNLRNLPICVFQSADDPRVPPDANRAAVQRVEAARTAYGGYEHFTYWEVPDRGHGYPEGGTDALLARIEAFERDPHPTRVVWEPVLPWDTTFYWLDWPTPAEGPRIDALVDRAAGTITVTTTAPTPGLAVLLSEDLVDMDRELTVTLNGTEVFRGPPPTSWATLVRTALENDPGRTWTARIPLN